MSGASYDLPHHRSSSEQVPRSRGCNPCDLAGSGTSRNSTLRTARPSRSCAARSALRAGCRLLCRMADQDDQPVGSSSSSEKEDRCNCARRGSHDGGLLRRRSNLGRASRKAMRHRHEVLAVTPRPPGLSDLRTSPGHDDRGREDARVALGADRAERVEHEDRHRVLDDLAEDLGRVDHHRAPVRTEPVAQDADVDDTADLRVDRHRDDAPRAIVATDEGDRSELPLPLPLKRARLCRRRRNVHAGILGQESDRLKPSRRTTLEVS